VETVTKWGLYSQTIKDEMFTYTFEQKEYSTFKRLSISNNAINSSYNNICYIDFITNSVDNVTALNIDFSQHDLSSKYKITYERGAAYFNKGRIIALTQASEVQEGYYDPANKPRV
jgi:hypothetical protein